MADFQTRVDGLTGLTAGTHYTTAELTEYLKDGVLEITNRIVALKPDQAELFQRAATSDSQGVDVGRSQILYVMREANLDGSSDGSSSWKPCRKIPTSMQSKVADSTSLHFASIHSPAFAVESNGVINVYPVPSANNGIKVLHVNKTPVNGSGSSLAHNHDDILYFPEDKVYLVVIYAGLKALTNAMAAKNSTVETSLFPDDIALPVPPTAPSVDLTAVDTSGITDPTFRAPVMSIPDWSDTNNWISVEEDSEMLSARVAEINTKVQTYNAELQEAKLSFDQENSVLQKDLQVAVQNAQLYEKNILAKYQQQIIQYEKKITGLVGKFSSEIQKGVGRLSQYRVDYEWLQSRYLMLQKEYDTAFIILRGNAPQISQPRERRQERKRPTKRRRSR